MTTKTKDNPKADDPDGPRWREAARHWEPNPLWFHPLMATAWVWLIGSMLHYAEVPSPFSGVAAVGVMAASWLALIQVSKADDDPETMTIEERYGSAYLTELKRFTALVGAVACGWLAFTVDYSPVEPVSWGTLLLGGVVCGAGYAVLLQRRPKHREAKIADDERKEVARTHLEHARIVTRESNIWGPWLHKASKSLQHVHVADVRETRAGYTLTLDNDAESGEQPATFSDLRAALPTLAQLASKHFYRQDVPFATHQLRAEESPDYGHIWYLHVSTKQPLKQSIPYVRRTGPSSILEPQKIGLYEDGEDFTIDLYGQHGIMVSKTGGGKSVVCNNLFEAVTACNDSLIWATAIEKLVPLAFPWLVPWLRGDTDRPVFDRVAGEDPGEVAKLLADAYAYVKLQNKRLGAKDKHEPSPDDPGLVLIIDESPQLARRTDLRITTFDGEEWTVTKLLSALTALARSSGLSIWFLSQYGLMDSLGPHGNEVMRNVTLRIVGRTLTPFDGRQTLVGLDYVDTTKLKDYTLLAQPNADEPRAIPAKVHELYGLERIAPVALQHSQWRPEMRPEIAAQLEFYEGRWSAERQQDLVQAAEAEGYAWPANPDGVSAAALPDGPGGDTLSPGDNKRSGTTVVRHTRENLMDLEAKWRESAEKAKEAAGKYGTLGKHATLTLDAISNYEVPDGWWPLGDLAAAAGLADRADRSTWAEAGEELRNKLTAAPFYIQVVERDGRAGFLADDIRASFKAFLSGDGNIPRPRAPRSAQADAVLSALQGFDGEWVPVGELGRRAGLVDDNTDYRAASASFSALLRAEFQLPKEAFDRNRDGSVVSVSALRGAAV